MPKPRKLSDILRDIFGSNFGDDFNFDFNNETTPEEFMGDSDYNKTEETGTDSTGEVFTKTTYTSKDGKRKFTRTTINAKPQPIDFFQKMSKSKNNSDTQYKNRIYNLEQDLLVAVDKQEYEKAAKVRDEINKLKKSKV